MRNNYSKILIIVLLLAFSFCEDQFEYNSGAMLEFSCDTLKFDTIFTDEKSSVHFLKILNKSGKNININTIQLENNDNQIQLNINGRQTNSAENIELLKGDSIFVFAQAKLKHQKENYLHTNAIIVNTGGENQRVIITAYGICITKLNGTIHSDTTLPAHTAYLSHQGITVAKDAKLTIKEGVTIYFNKNCGLDVHGILSIEGNAQNPVTLQGIRPEEEYKSVPAQWNGISIGESSEDVSIISATIKNAQNGIICQDRKTVGTITIGNSIIQNHLFAGVNIHNVNAFIYNTLINNCGNTCLSIGKNGNYNIMHCTIADYWNSGYRSSAALICKNNDPESSFNALIVNSIIWGNRKSEIECEYPDNESNIQILNSLIKNETTENQIFNSCKFNIDPQFVNIDADDYRIKTESPAKDLANIGYLMLYSELETDYFGNSRSENTTVDAGFANCE